jgi:hypothetical protein
MGVHASGSSVGMNRCLMQEKHMKLPEHTNAKDKVPVFILKHLRIYNKRETTDARGGAGLVIEQKLRALVKGKH